MIHSKHFLKVLASLWLETEQVPFAGPDQYGQNALDLAGSYDLGHGSALSMIMGIPPPAPQCD